MDKQRARQLYELADRLSKLDVNTLSEEQITALIENKRVIGPQKDVKEVLNAIEIYENLENYNPVSEKSFLLAHQNLMNNLIENAGKYRTKGVGIVKGSKVEHVAPPFENVPFLMKDLFDYLNDSEEITLIKSCVLQAKIRIFLKLGHKKGNTKNCIPFFNII